MILRGTKKLLLYNRVKLVKTFGIATGQVLVPDAARQLRDRDNAAGPVVVPAPVGLGRRLRSRPPGPGNPLGTRWMGISAPYVGIHGTPDAASIGYSASHGCIRMRIPDAEWLFRRVDVGTPVFILAR